MKMKKLIIILLFAAIKLNAQQGTLIYSTSFEVDSSKYCSWGGFNSNLLDCDSCYFENFFDNVFTCLGTPDILMPCSSLPFLGNNPMFPGGFQYPKSGNCYAGLFSFEMPPPPPLQWREYIGIKLPSKLKTNKFYKVEYYVTFGEYCEYISICPQAIFHQDSIKYPYMIFTPDFNLFNTGKLNPNNYDTIADVTNWRKIEGIYQAVGNEKYLYLGNFLRDDETIGYLNYFNPDAGTDGGIDTYYGIDDLSVWELDSTVSVNENTATTVNATVYPNPASTFVTINLPQKTTNATCVFYNAQGQVVIDEDIISTQNINIANLPNGVYTVTVASGSGVLGYNKLVVVK